MISQPTIFFNFLLIVILLPFQLPRNATTTTSMNIPTMNPEIEKARQELEKLKQRERELEERLGSMYAGSHVTENRNTSNYSLMNERNRASQPAPTGSPHRRNSSTRERNTSDNHSGMTSRFSSMYVENKSPSHTTFSDHINTKYESISSTEQTNLNRPPYESYKERRTSEDVMPRFTPLHTTNIDIERPSDDMLQMRSHIQEQKTEEEKYTTFANSSDPRGNAYVDLANAMIDKKSPVTVYNRRTDAEELERKYPYPAKFGERRRSYDVKEEEDLNIVTKTEISNNPFDSSMNMNDDNSGMSPHYNPHASEILKDIELCLNNYGSEESSSLSYTETTPLRSKELINDKILDYLHKDEKLNTSDEIEEEIDGGIVDLRHDIHREIQINQQRERELKCERNMDPSSENSSDSEEESMQSIMSIRSKILKEIEEERQRDMEIQDQHRMRGLIPEVQAHVTSDYPDSLDDNSTVKNSDTEELFDAAEPHVENLPLDPLEYTKDDDCLRSKDSESAMHAKDDMDHEWLRLQREEELNRLRRVLSQDDMLGAETRDSESEFGEENFHSVDMRTKILKEIEEEQNREKELKMRFEREKKNVRRRSYNEFDDKPTQIQNSKPIIVSARKEVPEMRIEQEMITENYQENTVREELNGSDNFFNPRSLNDINKQTFGSREDLIAYLGSSSESPTHKQKKVPQSSVQRITIPKVFTERIVDNTKISKSQVHSNMRQVHESLLNSSLVEKHQYTSTESRQYSSTKDFDPVPAMNLPPPPTEKSPHTKHYVSPISTPQRQTPPRRSSVTFLDDTSMTNFLSPRMASQIATPEKILNERSKNPFLTDIEQSTNNIGNMYKYRTDYKEDHERRKSETSILSHDVRDDVHNSTQYTTVSPSFYLSYNSECKPMILKILKACFGEFIRLGCGKP